METTSRSSSSSSPIHEDIGSSVVSQIGLNLELGRGSESDHYYYDKKDDNNKLLKSFCGFTFLQIQELQLQALIFKYLSSGLPVPNHLLLPIWQSFSSSLAGYPTSLGIKPIYLDSRKGLDEEPWRCRRTDGKKWRCSKEALQNHKYCERHVHRGRHRSRKLVDASSKLGGAMNTTTNATSTMSPSTSTNAIIENYGSNLTELSISPPQNVSSLGILFPV